LEAKFGGKVLTGTRRPGWRSSHLCSDRRRLYQPALAITARRRSPLMCRSACCVIVSGQHDV